MTEGQLSPPTTPNSGAGVRLWESRKTLLRATCTRSGCWACAVFTPFNRDPTARAGFPGNRDAPVLGGAPGRGGPDAA